MFLAEVGREPHNGARIGAGRVCDELSKVVEIESAYGRELTWEELPERRASRIADYSSGDVLDVEGHDRFIDWFFDAGARLRDAVDTVASEVQAQAL